MGGDGCCVVDVLLLVVVATTVEGEVEFVGGDDTEVEVAELLLEVLIMVIGRDRDRVFTAGKIDTPSTRSLGSDVVGFVFGAIMMTNLFLINNYYETRFSKTTTKTKSKRVLCELTLF